MAVEFENNSYSSNNYGGAPKKVGGVTGFIMKLGLAKNQKGANKVMVFIIVLALLWIGFSMFASDGNNGAQTIYIEDLTPEQRQNVPEEFLNTLPSRN